MPATLLHPTLFAIRPALLKLNRTLILAAAIAASITGFVLTAAEPAATAAAQAGQDLTRLLRGMALIKAGMAAAALAAILWRLAAPITPLRLSAYAITTAAMAAGPGLIWTMAHIGLGALLLHTGLLATALLLWRDPAVPAQLAALIANRRTVPRPVAAP